MSYATPTELLTRFGAEEIAQRADRGIPRLVSSEMLSNALAGVRDENDTLSNAEQAALTSAVAVINRALTDADQAIDGYLAARYALPLAPVPGIVSRLACDIARYFLFDDVVTEQVEKRYSGAITFLKDVQAGRASFAEISVSDTSSESASAPASNVRVRTSRREFGDRFLERYK